MHTCVSVCIYFKCVCAKYVCLCVCVGGGGRGLYSPNLPQFCLSLIQILPQIITLELGHNAPPPPHLRRLCQNSNTVITYVAHLLFSIKFCNVGINLHARRVSMMAKPLGALRYMYLYEENMHEL